MQSYEILIDDWMRILIGNVPFHFLLEVVFRVLFVFLLLVFSMRLMGKRMASQLSRNELVAMSSLAAAIGIPIQAPDRGLLPAVIVAIIVILGQRMIARIATTNETFEKVSQGDIGILVSDGTMNVQQMNATRISRERLLAQLRSEEVKQLGQVSRFYFEANGTFTIVMSDAPKPGLSIMPVEDRELVDSLPYVHDRHVCFNCGNDKEINTSAACPNCGHTRYVCPVDPEGL